MHRHVFCVAPHYFIFLRIMECLLCLREKASQVSRRSLRWFESCLFRKKKCGKVSRLFRPDPSLQWRVTFGLVKYDALCYIRSVFKRHFPECFFFYRSWIFFCWLAPKRRVLLHKMEHHPGKRGRHMACQWWSINLICVCFPAYAPYSVE